VDPCTSGVRSGSGSSKPVKNVIVQIKIKLEIYVRYILLY
jgi:hypothetical protein